MLLVVNADRATKLEKDKGQTVNLVNQSAVDIYYDSDPMRLNNTAPGVVPNGTKIAVGASIQILDWSRPLYFRAVSQVTLEVQP